MHHDDFGVIVEDHGRKKKLLVKGLGSGLKDSDKQDEPFWVYSPYFVTKPKQERKKKAGQR